MGNYQRNKYSLTYTKAERLLFILKRLVLVLSLYLLIQFGAIPCLVWALNNDGCLLIIGVAYIGLAAYFLFVGLPISAVLGFIAIYLPKFLKIVKYRQNPLPNEKTLTRKRIKYGTEAFYESLVIGTLVLLLVIFAFEGVELAEEMLGVVSYNAECASAFESSYME